MTLFAHKQILPVSLIIGVSVIAMVWVTGTPIHRSTGSLFSLKSMDAYQHTGSSEKTACYRHLQKARSAGSHYWWQKYKSCIAGN